MNIISITSKDWQGECLTAEIDQFDFFFKVKNYKLENNKLSCRCKVSQTGVNPFASTLQPSFF